MDESSSPQASGVVDAIEAVGASLLFLPPPRPDLGPIERTGVKNQGRGAWVGVSEANPKPCGLSSVFCLPGLTPKR
jgi:hypothetical protein